MLNKYVTYFFIGKILNIIFNKNEIYITGSSGIDIKVKNPLIGQKVDNVIKRYNHLQEKAEEVAYKLDQATDEKEIAKLKKYFELINKNIRNIEYYHSCLRIAPDCTFQMPEITFGRAGGTSLATAIRAAKINLNKTMEEIL